MGWASGSELMGEVVGAVQACVEDVELRRKIYSRIIPAFESADCDTLEECIGSDPAFDSELEKR